MLKSKLIIGLVAVILLLFSTTASYSQKRSRKAVNDSMSVLKKAGKLNGHEQIVFNIKPLTPVVRTNTSNKSSRTNACDCWQTVDNTWSVCPFDGSGGNGGPGTAPLYQNDDWTTPLINLPFTFCFYGTNYNSLYINNNGNVSFGAPYSTFTANPFPDPTFVMVAPFWGDVDTRGTGSGVVYYKVTPTALLVQWDSVGYYDSYVDKKNTFQLIITDGTNSIIPNGNNVSFCYQDMQWTTGDASNGVNGFGGTPATVGANKGDGVNYIQFGTFDTAGSVYNGPTGAASGIDWLDYKSFYFNTCFAGNIPPIANGMGYCDTMTLCVGTAQNFNILFMSPEAGQTTTVTATATLNGFTVTSNTPANNVQFNAQLIASASDVGYNTITFTATDNGTPAQTTTVNLVIHILNSPVVNSEPDASDCAGAVQLNATGGTIYTWSPAAGLSNPNIPNPTANPTVTTTYIVNVSNGTCSANDTIVIFAGSVINVSPNQSICAGQSVNLSASGGVTYSWSPAAGLNFTNIATPVATPATTTTYTVTDVDAAGCTGTGTVTITVTQYPVFTPEPDVSACNGPVQLNATGGTTYSWSPATGLSNPNIANPTANPTVNTTYIVNISNNNCSIPDTIVVFAPPAVSVSPNQTICAGQSVNLTSTGGTTYLWSPSSGLNNPNIANPVATPSSTTTYTVTITDTHGCTKTGTVTITVNPIAHISQFNYYPSSPVYVNTPISFTDTSVTNINGYTWTFGENSSSSSQNPTHSYPLPGTYNVCHVDLIASGCVDTVCKSVEIIPYNITIPNVITPDGNGDNDALSFKNLEYYPGSKIEIYNRWGNKIYENPDYKNDWQGIGKSDGTYYFILFQNDGKNTTIPGFFTILHKK